MATSDFLLRSIGISKRTGGLLKQIELLGRFPQIQLLVTPIGKKNGKKKLDINLTEFLSYNFNSSVMTPVDTFSFTFAAPDSPTPFYDRIKDGDIATLTANGIQIGQGIMDQVEIATGTESGESVNIS